MPVKLRVPQDRLQEYCRQWKITELSVFGSVLREDFSTGSDVDVLVSFDKDAEWSLFDLVDMQDELEEILGRDVDLLTRRGVEASHNPIRRDSILKSAQSLYKAA